MSFQIINSSIFNELKNKEDVLFIDVREDYEYEDNNVGGINIPMGEINAKLDMLSNHPSILFCCKSGKRSNAIGYHLNQKFPEKNIYSLEGGLESIQNLA